MKKTNLYGAMAFGLLLTACSSDNLSEPTNKPLEADQTFYVNLAIHADNPMTRAAKDNGTPDVSNFDAGTDAENKVNNAYFVFYDEDGLVVGDLVPVTLTTPTQSTATDGTVKEYYKSTVPVSVRKGEKSPTGVICYINPISPSSLQTTLSNIQTVNRERVTTNIGGQTYFGMSNSVYYTSSTGDGAKAPQITVPIQTGQLFKTEKEAQDAADKDLVVDIYVERYACKLQFTPAGVDEDGNSLNKPYTTSTLIYTTEGATPTANPVVLEFEPQYWALNARANKSYVIKSFRREAADGVIMADNYSYELLNYRINVADPQTKFTYGDDELGRTLGTNESWQWNNPTFKRSYWGMSPAYFQKEYPEVASDVNKVDMPYQDYLTYAELVGDAKNPSKGYDLTKPDALQPKYFMETTVGSAAINSANPAAAVASVIYVGQYKMTVNGTEIEGNPSFYTYLKGNVTVDGKTEQHPYVYFDANDNGESVVAGGESMLKRFCAQSTILFTKDAAGEYHELGLDDYATFISALEVAEIDDAVKKAVDGVATTALKLQANARSLQFKSAAAANDNGIYIADGNGYKSLVADDTEKPTNSEIRISEANAILMQQVGYAYYYDAGKGYFNIPVRHFGWYRTGNDNNKTVDGKPVAMNWRLVRVGDFGMVRNHSYNVVVNKITGLASGINGNDTPIVPPASTEDYYVAYKVNILKWAVVPTQSVDL